MKRRSLSITALLAGACLALVAVVPASAVSESFTEANCGRTHSVETSSYGKYAITHKATSAGGVTKTKTFSNGAAYVTNYKGDWGFGWATSGNASGLYLSSASGFGCN